MFETILFPFAPDSQVPGMFGKALELAQQPAIGIRKPRWSTFEGSVPGCIHENILK